MSTKTCKQTVTDIRTGRTVTRSIPHIVPDWDASGYARCEACGQDIYVGQGPRSPYAMQVEEGEYVRRIMRGDARVGLCRVIAPPDRAESMAVEAERQADALEAKKVE